MIRLVLAGVIIILSTYIGYKMREYYQKKYILSSKIVEFLEFIHSEIRYKLTPLNDILASFGDSMLNGEFVNAYLNDNPRDNLYMTTQEYDDLSKICDYVRVSDRDNCLKTLAEEIGVYQDKLKLAKDALDKNGSLDLKLSILIGIGIAIMVL